MESDSYAMRNLAGARLPSCVAHVAESACGRMGFENLKEVGRSAVGRLGREKIGQWGIERWAGWPCLNILRGK